MKKITKWNCALTLLPVLIKNYLLMHQLISICYTCNIIASSDWKGVAIVLTSALHKQGVSTDFMVLLLIVPVILPLPSSPSVNLLSHVINGSQCFEK
jgi:hypothetical protein